MNRPQLLVSVRDASEVRAALAGGARIIDVKEPKRGALGMADIQTLSDVVVAVDVCKREQGVREIAISAALGELSDWHGIDELPLLPEGVTYFKLGLAGCGYSAQWRHHWLDIRERWEQRMQHAMNWIAVVYADWQRGHAPNPAEVVQGAMHDSNCVGVLIDTWVKDGTNLMDHLSAKDLTQLSQQVRSASLLFALAGRVDANILPELASCEPDVIGIRSAACEAGERSGEVDQMAVARFTERMNAVFESASVPQVDVVN